jgi:hypothetical protein
MKKYLFFPIFLLLGFFAISNLYYISPCDTPIHYKLGSVDKRFNITPDELLVDIESSADIWSKAEGKNLFVNDPKGPLTINLVFDERQALTDQIKKLRDELSSGKNTLNAQIANYKELLSQFNQKATDLNNLVEYWNQRGGAPTDVYEKLISEQKSLQAEEKELNQLAKILNQNTQSYNSQVIKLNNAITTFNQQIITKPEEGFYDGPNQRIDIYFVTDKNELIHTLAHEFGHALGINHNQNPKSIMYPQTSTTLTLTDEDKIELQNICQKVSFFHIFEERVIFLKNRLEEIVAEISQ